MYRRQGTFVVVSLMAAVAQAASHSDAPLSKQDPQTNFTDVYAFIGNNRAGVKVLNVIAHVRPFCEPGDGVVYDRFADDARYSINIANPTTGELALRYDFQFSSVTSGYKNLNTVLSYGLGTEAGPIQSIGDARQNYTQTYQVTKVVGNTSQALTPTELKTAPPNVGKKTTPLYNDANGVAVSGAATYNDLDPYTKQAIYDLDSGETVFAGMRDDGFYSDIPGIFDLLNARILDNDGVLFETDSKGRPSVGQDGNGVDGFKGFNTLAYAVQIPIASLPAFQYTAAYVPGTSTGVGVYASASRPRLTLRVSTGNAIHTGPWVQVNRMGNPLFNEGLVALKDKDQFNRTSPTTDTALFKTYAENPELAFLINFVVFQDPTGQKPFAISGRSDLVAVFIPEVLRVDTTTEPVRVAGQAGFQRLSFIDGDVTATGRPSGWPNGRRVGDDVVDIALTAIANGPSYGSPLTIVGDNVDHNDMVYNQVFPYSATPQSGTSNRKDPQ